MDRKIETNKDSKKWN